MAYEAITVPLCSKANASAFRIRFLLFARNSRPKMIVSSLGRAFSHSLNLDGGVADRGSSHLYKAQMETLFGPISLRDRLRMPVRSDLRTSFAEPRISKLADFLNFRHRP